MKKFIKVVLIFVIFTFLTGIGFSQVELHLFGQFNVNMSYPGDGTSQLTLSIVDQLQAIQGTSLEQKGGIGFGGRIAYNITPNFAVEGTFEYILAKTQFQEAIETNLTNYILPLGPNESFSFNKGGSILRFYGNLIYNFSSPGKIVPYITAGMGMTSFTLKKGDGPEFIWTDKLWTLDFLWDFYYENVSVLTFNGGFGVKFKISPRFGVRLDGRIFLCSPEINQFVDWTFFSIKAQENTPSYTTTGSHIDTSFNVGVYVAL